jgi:Na+-driven multidrug efflux pump
VKHTFTIAASIAVVLMIIWGVACYFGAGPMVRLFSDDAGVIAVGSEYLRIIAWTFVGSGIIFVSSSMFQAMGNTIPPLAASFARIVLVAVPAIVMSRMPGFELWWIWYLSVGALVFQLVTVLALLQREFRVRLTWPSVTTPSSATAGTH